VGIFIFLKLKVILEKKLLKIWGVIFQLQNMILIILKINIKLNQIIFFLVNVIQLVFPILKEVSIKKKIINVGKVDDNKFALTKDKVKDILKEISDIYLDVAESNPNFKSDKAKEFKKEVNKLLKSNFKDNIAISKNKENISIDKFLKVIKKSIKRVNEELRVDIITGMTDNFIEAGEFKIEIAYIVFDKKKKSKKK
jgi:hypothetical protein